MTDGRRDSFEARLDRTTAQPRLHLGVSGPDRPNLIAEATTYLEKHRLLLETITFNLLLPNEHRYVMEIVARGTEDDIRSTRLLSDANELLPTPKLPERSFHWPSVNMLHLAMDTPDDLGLIAQVACAVGRRCETHGRDLCPCGSFVHLMGILHNSGGPQGGTAYFAVRANIAAQTPEIRDEIEAHLLLAREHGRDRDLWTCNLDRPAAPGSA